MAGVDDVAGVLIAGLHDVVQALIALRTALVVSQTPQRENAAKQMATTHNEHATSEVDTATLVTTEQVVDHAAMRSIARKKKRQTKKSASRRLHSEASSIMYIDSGPEDDNEIGNPSALASGSRRL